MIVRSAASATSAWYARPPAAYAGIALAWFHQIPTGNELVLDTVAADYWRAPLRRDARAARRLPARRAARQRASATGCASPRSSTRGPASSRCGSTGRGLDRLARPRRASSSSGASSTPRPLVDGASVLALGRAGRPLVADHRQGARRPHAPQSATIPPGTRVVAEGPFGVFTDGSRAGARRSLLIAGGIGITPDPRAARGDATATSSSSTASIAEEDVVFGDELEELAARARRRAALRRRRPRDRGRPRACSRPPHLRELVPDLARARRLRLRARPR